MFYKIQFLSKCHAASVHAVPDSHALLQKLVWCVYVCFKKTYVFTWICLQLLLNRLRVFLFLFLKQHSIVE